MGTRIGVGAGNGDEDRDRVQDGWQVPTPSLQARVREEKNSSQELGQAGSSGVSGAAWGLPIPSAQGRACAKGKGPKANA